MAGITAAVILLAGAVTFTGLVFAVTTRFPSRREGTPKRSRNFGKLVFAWVLQGLLSLAAGVLVYTGVGFASERFQGSVYRMSAALSAEALVALLGGQSRPRQ